MCIVLVIVAKLFLKPLKDQNYITHFERFFAVEIMFNIMFNVDRNTDNDDDVFRHIEKTATIVTVNVKPLFLHRRKQPKHCTCS